MTRLEPFSKKSIYERGVRTPSGSADVPHQYKVLNQSLSGLVLSGLAGLVSVLFVRAVIPVNMIRFTNVSCMLAHRLRL